MFPTTARQRPTLAVWLFWDPFFDSILSGGLFLVPTPACQRSTLAVWLVRQVGPRTLAGLRRQAHAAPGPGTRASGPGPGRRARALGPGPRPPGLFS